MEHSKDSQYIPGGGKHNQTYLTICDSSDMARHSARILRIGVVIHPVSQLSSLSLVLSFCITSNSPKSLESKPPKDDTAQLQSNLGVRVGSGHGLLYPARSLTWQRKSRIYRWCFHWTPHLHGTFHRCHGISVFFFNGPFVESWDRFWVGFVGKINTLTTTTEQRCQTFPSIPERILSRFQWKT